MSGSELRGYYRNVGRFRGRGRLHDDYAYHPYNPSNRPSWNPFVDLGVDKWGWKDWLKFGSVKAAGVEGYKQATGTYFVPMYKDPAKGMSSSGSSAQVNPSVQSNVGEDVSQNSSMYVTPAKRARTDGGKSASAGVTVIRNPTMKSYSKVLFMSVPRGIIPKRTDFKHIANTKWYMDRCVYPSFYINTANSAFANTILASTYTNKHRHSMYTGADSLHPKEKMVSGQWTCMELQVLECSQNHSATSGSRYLYGILDFVLKRYANREAYIAGAVTIEAGTEQTHSMLQMSTTDTAVDNPQMHQYSSTGTKDYNFLLKHSLNMRLYNAEAYTQLVEVYVLVRKLGLETTSTVSTVTSTEFASHALETGAAESDSAFANDSVLKPWEIGSKLTSSKYFNRRWRVVSKRRLEMRPGADVSIVFKRGLLKINTLDIANISAETETNYAKYYPGASYTLYLRVRGETGLVDAKPISAGSAPTIQKITHPSVTIANAAQTGSYNGTLVGRPTGVWDLQDNNGVLTTDSAISGNLSAYNSVVPTYDDTVTYNAAGGVVAKADTQYGQLSTLPGKLVVQLSESCAVRAIGVVMNNYHVSGVQKQLEISDAATYATFVGTDDLSRSAIKLGIDTDAAD